MLKHNKVNNLVESCVDDDGEGRCRGYLINCCCVQMTVLYRLVLIRELKPYQSIREVVSPSATIYYFGRSSSRLISRRIDFFLCYRRMLTHAHETRSKRFPENKILL